VKHPCFTIAEELTPDGEPCAARRAAALADAVHEVDGDGAEDPREDDGIHAAPSRKAGEDHVEEDVICKCIALQREENKVTPSVVVGGEGVQDNGHEGPIFWTPAA
jgi:hypothetical protein